MNVGEAAKRTRLPAKTLRYYEDIGLITPGRKDNGYRDYSDTDIQKLRFLQRARSLGFSVDNCRTLLSLYEDNSRASADVRALASKHLKTIERKIDELQGLHVTLKHLVQSCHGDNRPDCPILEELAGKKMTDAK